MPGEYRPPARTSGPFRTVAIAIMVLGFAGFVATLILYGDNALCFFASLVVVFAGLGILLYMRRNPLPDLPALTTRPERPAQPQPPEEPWEPVTQEEEEAPVSALVDRATEVFEQHGAQVTVETRRAERCILTVHMPTGEQYTVLVNDTSDVVDVPEIRALAAMVAGNASALGYYITNSGFTARAISYADSHAIRLIDQGQVDQI